MHCTKCDVEIPSARIQLGYKECLNCSSVTAYKAHVVYPHKTGAVVEPIATEAVSYTHLTLPTKA